MIMHFPFSVQQTGINTLWHLEYTQGSFETFDLRKLLPHRRVPSLY